jgi:hypothetical protein
MNDFFDNLLAKSFGAAEGVQPRLASLFEPVRAEADPPGTASSYIDRNTEQVPGGIRVESSSDDLAQSSSAARVAAAPLPATLKSSRPGDAARANTEKETTTEREERHIDAVEHPHIPLPAITPARVAPHRTIVIPQVAPPRIDERLSSRSSEQRTLELRANNSTREMRAAAPPDNAQSPGSIAADQAGPRIMPVQPTRSAGPSQPTRITDGAAPTISLDSDLTPAVPASQQQRQNRPASTGPGQQTIRVTIGRIDVRAVMPASPARRSAPASKHNALTLNEYLKQRNGGHR